MSIKHVCGLIALVFIGSIVAMSACTVQPPTDDGTIVDGGTGTLRVLITDKPYPFDLISEALVTITKIEVRRAGGDEEADNGDEEDDDGNENENGNENGNENENENENGNENEGDDDGDEDGDDGDGSPFVVIFEGESIFNLLDLQNGRSDLLAEAELEAGTYTQMRVFVTDGQVTLISGEMPPLDIPSGETSGIKLNFEFDVTADEETVLLLDVDLSKLFTPIPGGRIEDPSSIREFKFRPSVAMSLINLIDAASISGLVSDEMGNPLADVSVTAFDEDDEEITSTATDDDGTYVLGGLLAGTYRVDFSATGFEDISVSDVTVEAGETREDVDATMTAEDDGNDNGDDMNENENSG